MTARLARYKSPKPCCLNQVAMPDNVSPRLTVYVIESARRREGLGAADSFAASEVARGVAATGVGSGVAVLEVALGEVILEDDATEVE